MKYKNAGLTKEHSKMLYGIAILLMLFHHLFCIPARLNCEYYSVIDAFTRSGTEERIAWFCKICVAIYAFISGYALQRVCLSNVGDALISENYKVTFCYLFRFMKKFWIVFTIFVPMGFVLGKLNGVRLQCLLYNFVGITDNSISGEWWYVKFYLQMLLIFPIIDGIFKFFSVRLSDQKKWRFCGAVLSILGVIWFLVLFGLDKYAWVFTVGYLSGALKIFEFLDNFLRNRSLKFLVSVIMFGICFAIRWKLATGAAYSACDYLIVLPVIYSLIGITEGIPIVKHILKMFGRYSTYMWLTHTFFIYYYFQKMSTVSRNSIIMFVQIIFVSWIVAILLERLEKVIDQLIRNRKDKEEGK